MQPVEAFSARHDPAALVVTAAADGERAGCLVVFATQCSINPFRLLVGLSQRNATTRVAAAAQALVVHLLRDDQVEVAEWFGGHTGDDHDTFAGRAWHPWRDGTPVLADCAGWVAGPIVARHDLGDHRGVVIEPDDAGGGLHDRDDAEEPRILRLRDVTHITPGHPA